MCLIAAHADPSVQFCPQRVGVIAHFTCVTNLQESAKNTLTFFMNLRRLA